jgi:hypothetical protein
LNGVCDDGRGFYFSIPLPIQVARSLLATPTSEGGQVTLFPVSARRVPRVG